MPVVWKEGDPFAFWYVDDERVVLEFDDPPRTVTAWNHPESVVVVESFGRNERPVANAVVYNPDGSERLRLSPPAIDEIRDSWIGFDQVFVGEDGLVAVFIAVGGFFWGVPDLTTGEIRLVAPWR